ncbi:MAG: DUF1513 domain-containing protein [Pseudomonadota bacterium]
MATETPRVVNSEGMRLVESAPVGADIAAAREPAARLSRRGLLRGALASALVSATGGCLPARQGVGGPRLVGCAVDRAATDYAVVALDARNELCWRTPLPARGHAVIGLPSREQLLVLARRPGAFALLLDARSGAVLRRLDQPAGRFFYGHGAELPESGELLTAEFDGARDSDWIVIRDASTLREIDRLPAHGTGPHDLALLPEGRLLIANGGYRSTRERRELSASGRPDSQLVVVSLSSGRALERLRVDDPLASLRHVAVDVDERGQARLFVAAQRSGRRAHPDRALLYAADDGGGLQPVAAPDATWLGFAGYLGSIMMSQGLVVATSPPGRTLGVWRVADLTFLGSFSAGDLAGLAAAPDGFVAADGRGALYRFTPAQSLDSASVTRVAGIRWDNHLTAV